jgi:hypothetical protein
VNTRILSGRNLRLMRHLRCSLFQNGDSRTIAKLFVEGTLEFQILTPILQGNPLLQQGGSKYSLKPRALTERRDHKVVAGYLRDRDFDLRIGCGDFNIVRWTLRRNRGTLY